MAGTGRRGRRPSSSAAATGCGTRGGPAARRCDRPGSLWGLLASAITARARVVDRAARLAGQAVARAPDGGDDGAHAGAPQGHTHTEGRIDDGPRRRRAIPNAGVGKRDVHASSRRRRKRPRSTTGATCFASTSSCSFARASAETADVETRCSCRSGSHLASRSAARLVPLRQPVNIAGDDARGTPAPREMSPICDAVMESSIRRAAAVVRGPQRRRGLREPRGGGSLDETYEGLFHVPRVRARRLLRVRPRARLGARVRPRGDRPPTVQMAFEFRRSRRYSKTREPSASRGGGAARVHARSRGGGDAAPQTHASADAEATFGGLVPEDPGRRRGGRRRGGARASRRTGSPLAAVRANAARSRASAS